MAVQQQTPASDLERRKQVKLCLRSDLEISPHKYEGRTYYVVKDPVALRYYRFKEQEHFLLRLLDGDHTLDDAQKAFEAQFRPDRLTLEDLEQFGQQLLKAGLVHNESPQAGKHLFEQLKKRNRSKVWQTLTNILYIKIPVFDPEKLLTRMLPFFRFLFTTWFLLASVAFMLSALLLVMTHFDTFRERLPSFHEFFSFKTVIYLWVALGVVKVIHEFGHGLSCKAFGGEVHEMGILILCLSPALYCNVSDAWTLPSKWKRIIIGGAGIYVELMIAAIATYVWWYTPGQPFVNYMALCLMFICSVNTVLFNGNPLMRFDGYYVLSDLLEIPNLRERSNRYIQRLAMQYGLGVEVPPEPYMALWRRSLFVTYAVASYIYRWVLTFTILYFLSHLLGPKLRVVSQMLALAALASLLGWPTYRLIQAYRKRGRLPDMKLLNTSVTAAVLAALILAFFFLPLPVSRIRETGVVQVHPLAMTPVPIKVSGTLKKILVREGQEVREGTPLAVLSNFELENELDSARAELTVQERIVQAFHQQLPVARRDPSLLRNLNAGLLMAKHERERAAADVRFKSRLNEQLLTLIAPRDGRVMGLPRKEEIGKYWEKDKSGPLCSIGKPGQYRVLLPVAPDDYDILRENLEKAQREGRDLEVTIRIQGRGPKTWPGRITLDHLPKEVAKEIPLELSTKAGGPLAVKPTSDKDHLYPQTQVYLVPIDIVHPDSAVVPGALSQVKIHCEYRSAAWWVWRQISKTFDLGLL